MGLQARLIKRVPIGVREHPIELAFCVLATMTGVASVFGVQISRALEILPYWAQLLWAALIITGCAAWTIGLITTKGVGSNIIITRIELMIFGLSIVSGTCFVFAISLVITNGTMAILAAVPFFTFSVGTYIRRVDLIGRIKDHDGS